MLRQETTVQPELPRPQPAGCGGRLRRGDIAGDDAGVSAGVVGGSGRQRRQGAAAARLAP